MWPMTLGLAKDSKAPWLTHVAIKGWTTRVAKTQSCTMTIGRWLVKKKMKMKMTIILMMMWHRYVRKEEGNQE